MVTIRKIVSEPVADASLEEKHVPDCSYVGGIQAFQVEFCGKEPTCFHVVVEEKTTTGRKIIASWLKLTPFSSWWQKVTFSHAEAAEAQTLLEEIGGSASQLSCKLT